VTTRQRVLLDECLPHPLRHDLSMFDTVTARFAGFAGLQNGQLLAAIEGRFDVFVTVDSSLPRQQNLTSISFGIVVLSVPSNRLADLRATLPRLIQAISLTRPGEVTRVI
jgi:hypothetical protein